MRFNLSTVLHRLHRPQLKLINTLLFCIIVVIDGYIAAAPLLPTLIAQPTALKGSQAKSFIATHSSPGVAASNKPEQNELIIPALQLDQPIYEGRDTYAELDKGVWRWPNGSTPDKGSNTILLGHRFTYTTPQGVFYFLNLLKVGDTITINWSGTLYTYQVYQTEVVSPDHVEILDPTPQPTLTMYTCTPTWWPVNRLVIKAHLEKQG